MEMVSFELEVKHLVNFDRYCIYNQNTPMHMGVSGPFVVEKCASVKHLVTFRLLYVIISFKFEEAMRVNTVSYPFTGLPQTHIP